MVSTPSVGGSSISSNVVGVDDTRMLIVYLLMTVLTQYGCIRTVYKLTTECASLTVTLVVTNRKFLSILFSILYFGNPFTWKHWLGTFVVFGGTLLFTFVGSSNANNRSKTSNNSSTSASSSSTAMATESSINKRAGDEEDIDDDEDIKIKQKLLIIDNNQSIEKIK